MEPPPLGRKERLINVFGKETIFIPMQRGDRKKPGVKWKKSSDEHLRKYEEMLDDEDVTIAIRCENGLVAIDIDTGEAAMEFAEANPRLMETTQTKGSRGRTWIVRIKGECPDAFSWRREKGDEDNTYEWKSNRDALQNVAGPHNSGCQYRFLKEVSPIEVEFSEINWPEGWRKPPLIKDESGENKKLEEEFGDPFSLRRDQGNITIVGINERYWAGFYAHKWNSSYNALENWHYEYDEDRGLHVRTGVPQIEDRVARELLRVSREFGQPIDNMISKAKLGSIADMVKGVSYHADMFSNRKLAIHFRNVMIAVNDDWSLSVEDFGKEFMSRNQLPFEYDPDAKCPKFDEFIVRTMGEEGAETFDRWAGMAMTGRNLTHTLMMVIGPGGTGKGTIHRTFEGITGKENIGGLRPELLHDRFEMGRHMEKLVIAGFDTPREFLNTPEAEALKAFTGGDALPVEFKYSNASACLRESPPVVVYSNHHQNVWTDGETTSWERRLTILGTSYKPAEGEKVESLDKVFLREEGPGICARFVRGLARLLDDMKNGLGFRLSASQKAEVEKVLKSSESPRVFITTQLEDVEGGSISLNELEERYMEYCSENDWVSPSSTEARKRLKGLMLQVRHLAMSKSVQRFGKNVDGWRNVSFKNGGENGFED